MDSPLRRWMHEKSLTQGGLGSIAGIDRSAVACVVNGYNPLRGVLRQFLEQAAPRLVAEQDQWYQQQVAIRTLKVQAA